MTKTLVLLLCTASMAALNPDQFLNPPDSARPMTWMHMMNNNASKEGLAKDLQGLADAGVGGALIFSVKKGIADGNVMFNSPEFREILVHGTQEADRLGLKIGIHNCDGWSSSGGPWVSAEEAMKRVVCSDTVVSGGTVDVNLKQPPTHSGFYRDIAVVAYPTTEEELDAFQNQPILTSSTQENELLKLTDGQLDTEATFAMDPKSKDKPWLLFSYGKPFPARSIHVGHRNRNGNATLYASQDGEHFDKVVGLTPAFRSGKIYWNYEASFPVVKARFFKLVFDTSIKLTSVDLAPFTRLPAWLGQNATVRKDDDDLQNLSSAPADAFVPLDQVRVLTVSLDGQGRCQTELPPGIWRVVRFGYTLTGAYNHPATDSGRGWECDKLDAKALDKHFAAYVGKVAEQCGPLVGKSFYFSEVDSYEMGGQNWTAGFDKTFQAEKGYDLIPMLPLVMGRLIGDASTADAVLGDFRNLLGKLWIENYFQRFTDLCHQYGMKAYNEPYGNAAFDNLTAGGAADIPMGEFWLDSDRYMTSSAVYAAHTYGKPVISAESFTSWRDLNWKLHPYLMKRAGDTAWIAGINEFMFHRFAHQANPHVAPGMTMDSIGSHIDRTQTWWLNAGKAWMKYLQRGSFLLRQGVPVSDLLVYVGEGTPHPQPGRSTVKLPYGYNMDCCDEIVLKHRISVEDGKLVLPEGTIYQILLLHNTDQMSLSTLYRLNELAQAGATIVGPQPVEPIGYLERTTKREVFTTFAQEMWGDGSQPNRVGKGWVVTGEHWPTDIKQIAIIPDLIIAEEPQAEFIHRQVGQENIYFFQNRSDSARTLNCSFRTTGHIPELWHADSGRMERQIRFSQADGRTSLPVTLEANGSVFVVFRETSQGVDPVRNVTGPNPAQLCLKTSGEVQLTAANNGSYQIERISGAQQQVEIKQIQSPIIMGGGWQVHFDGPGLTENPLELWFEELSDWKDHECPGVQYYSGTALYRKTLDIPQPWLAGSKRFYLDLGQVEIAAEVTINGKAVGALWKPPFVIDVTDAIKPGKNALEIKVTNLWTNRLIGDQSLEKTDGYRLRAKMPDWYVNNEPMPEGPRSTFCTYNFYDKDRTLLPSGLLGPVRFVQEAQKTIGE
ncbi:glycosyl hydrolase [Planctomycetota bacterium]